MNGAFQLWTRWGEISTHGTCQVHIVSSSRDPLGLFSDSRGLSLIESSPSTTLRAKYTWRTSTLRHRKRRICCRRLPFSSPCSVLILRKEEVEILLRDWRRRCWDHLENDNNTRAIRELHHRVQTRDASHTNSSCHKPGAGRSRSCYRTSTPGSAGTAGKSSCCESGGESSVNRRQRRNMPALC